MPRCVEGFCYLALQGRAAGGVGIAAPPANELVEREMDDRQHQTKDVNHEGEHSPGGFASLGSFHHGSFRKLPEPFARGLLPVALRRA